MAQNDRRDAEALPEGWVWTTIEEAYEVVLGQSPPSSTYNMDGVGLPFYQGKAEFGDLYPTTVKWCSAPKKVAEAGDVLISVRAPVGPTNLCREESCIGRGLSAVRPLAEMPSLYLLYFLRLIEPDWEGKATGTTFSAISGNVLRSQEIPLPPLPEQHRIVAEIETQFTRLAAGIAALKRAQANLRRYKAALLKAACEGRLLSPEEVAAIRKAPGYEPADVLLQRILAERRAQWEAEHPRKTYKEPTPPDTSGLPVLPGGWVWATLGQCFKVQRGRFSVRPRNDPRYYDGPYPFVQIGDLPKGGGSIIGYSQTLNKDGLRISRVFPKGTVLIAIVGATIANTGILTFDGCCPDSLVAVQAYDEIRLRYVDLYLRSKKLEIRQASYASGGQPNINLRTLMPYPFPLPPLAEQQRIVAKVERRLSVVAELENQVEAALRRAERLRQAILERAFAGRLVPQDPNDEPASALLERIGAQRQGHGTGKGKRRTPRQERLPTL